MDRQKTTHLDMHSEPSKNYLMVDLPYLKLLYCRHKTSWSWASIVVISSKVSKSWILDREKTVLLKLATEVQQHINLICCVLYFFLRIKVKLCTKQIVSPLKSCTYLIFPILSPDARCLQSGLIHRDRTPFLSS